ncbi:MAG TPA: phosphatase PAP2 family protein [Lacipirellulaceae bacterium]|nr:phosphatase PAP2 family protein [Lacipirellulaceae bacterium]
MKSLTLETGTGQHRWQWWQAAMLALIVLAALTQCDIPLARLTYQHAPSHAVIRVLELIQFAAGNGAGVIIVLTVVIFLSRTKLSRIPLLASIALGGGLLADIAKMCVARSRPHSTDLAVATFSSTFHGILPLLSAPSGLQSFPSGHSATAIGLAVALCLIYPRGRWFFGILAVTVASIRVILHAHFPTDVAAGLMLGGTWAFICYRGFAAPVFAWCERTIDCKITQRSVLSDADVTVRCQPIESSLASRTTLDSSSKNRNAA